MFNRVILAGNLTRDPELRYLPSGSAICNTGIATNRRYKKQDGSSGEDVCFIDVTFFGRTAEVANQYLKKGSKVLVEGRLKLDSWTDQSGQKKSKHSIVADSMQMIGAKDGAQNISDEGTHHDDSLQPSSQSEQSAKPTQARQNLPEIDLDDEEIPF